MSGDRLPSLTESSEISRLAVRQFVADLPPMWTVSKPQQNDDYWIEVALHVVDGKDTSSHQCHVQVSGTRASDGTETSFRIKATTRDQLSGMPDVAVFLRKQLDEERQGLFRKKVVLGRQWLVGINDPRIAAAPDADGWVHVVCNDTDLVDKETLRFRLSKLSYRRRWLDLLGGSPYIFWVESPDIATALPSIFGHRIPENLGFQTGDRSAPAFQAEIVRNSTSLVLRDHATTTACKINTGRPDVALLVLATFLGLTGAWSPAIAILVSSSDLIGDDAIATRGTEEGLDLLNIVVAHATDDQLLEIATLALKQGTQWGARWFATFALSRRLQGMPKWLLDRCFEVWRDAEKQPAVQILRAHLLILHGFNEECASLLGRLSLSAVSDAGLLFELGFIAARMRQYEKARGAWEKAARLGHARFSCQLEIARAYFAEGDLVKALELTHNMGEPRDRREQVLLDILKVAGKVIQDSKELQKILRDVATLSSATAALLEKRPASRSVATHRQICLLSLIRAFRNEDDIDAWALALEHGIRGKAPPVFIDAMVELSGMQVGGEPLRRASIALKNPKEKTPLEKWQTRIELLREIASLRRVQAFARAISIPIVPERFYHAALRQR